MPATKRKAEKKMFCHNEAELQRLTDELLQTQTDVETLVDEVLQYREFCPETIMKMFTASMESNLLKLESIENDEEYNVPQSIVDVADSLAELVDIDSLQPEKQELIRDLEKMRLRVDETDRHTDLLTSALTENPVVVLPKARHLSRLTDLSFL